MTNLVLKCPKCRRSEEIVEKQKAVHLGAYCACCGAWIKWLPKKKQTNAERRREFINHIEKLYPADAPRQDPAVVGVGEDLMLDAIRDCWRDLPTAVLDRYAELCQIYHDDCDSEGNF